MDLTEASVDNVHEEAAAAKQCFSPIPSSRRYWAPVLQTTFRLCPSMDLMVLGLQQLQYGQAHAPQKDNAAVAAAQTLWLHRTVTAQKLATLSTGDVDETSPDEDEDDAVAGVTHTCWRPDGRLLACVNTRGQVILYHVEDIILASSSWASSSNSIMMTDDSQQQQQQGIVSVVELPDGSGDSSETSSEDSGEIYLQGGTSPPTITTIGMTWAHVGRPHPAWELDEYEQEEDLFWRYRSKYVDRQATFLPPTEYAFGNNNRGNDNDHDQHSHSNVGSRGLPNSPVGRDNGNNDDFENDNKPGTRLPTSQTPLSLLCVATADHGLNLFLHGRFLILKHLPFSGATLQGKHVGDCNPLNAINPELGAKLTPQQQHKDSVVDSELNSRNPIVDMVVSTNLTHILIHMRESRSLTLYTIPSLARERYTLQSVSALSCTLIHHVKGVKTSLTEIADSWRSSIKPMDVKIAALGKLLNDYDLEGSLTEYLVQYVLSGHTRTAPNLSNAIDQFFTSVQMNDQLLQRLERSLSAAVANVESQLRMKLLGPAQALVYQAEELCGVVRSLPEDNGLLLVDDALKFYRACTDLFISAQMALADLIEARFRLRDFVAWLRSTGSQIKANGTAEDSVQRKNAKKRRVPDSVVQRMLSYLRTKEVGTVGGITEMILGIRFCQHFQEDTDPILLDSRPSSPTSVGAEGVWSDPGLLNVLNQATNKLPFITFVAGKTLEELLQRPQEYMQSSLYCTHLVLHSMPAKSSPLSNRKQESPLVAMTTRLGRGGADMDPVPYAVDDDMGSFFCPYVDDDADAEDYREWALVAEPVTHESSQGDYVKLCAVPLSWSNEDENSGDDPGMHGIASPCFWSSLLRLPDGCSVVDLAFYGDDGKSSLGSVFDQGTGKESRQCLTLLVIRALAGETTTGRLELWLVPYDACRFCRKAFDVGPEGNLGLFISVEELLDEAPAASIQPLSEDEDEEGSGDSGAVYAKTRVLLDSIDSNADGRSYKLIVSGSRGVGAALVTQNSTTSVEMFDLEEDEEADDDEEE